MAASNIAWKGIAQVEKLAKFLPTRLAGQKLRGAMRYALIPVRDAMRDKVPVRSKKLWYSTDITIQTGSRLEDFVAYVGPRRKRGAWNQQGWHANLIEYGTKKHTITSKTEQGMPIFKVKKFLGFAKEVEVEGTKGTYPFKTAIDANWDTVGKRFAEKTAEILRDEIKNITQQFGNVATT